jgi:SAM-dependent methyltransferase
VDSKEALAILGHDMARLRSQGIRVQTMAAHGFAWPDGVRSWYDNYAAEFDFTAGDPSVQSQFHVLERFAERGRPVSAHLGVDRMKRMQSVWLPRHVPFGWLHARAGQTQLRADALTLTDAGGTWKYIGIRKLVSLLPQLAGCLVVLNVHPVYYAYGDDGLEFVPRSTQLADHRWLADLLGERPSETIEPPQRADPGIRYRGRLDFNRIGPERVSDRLAADELERLNRKLRRVNARYKGGPWFDRLVNSPNAEIIAWLNEFVDSHARERLRVIELCGGVGPVAVGLTRHGFRPENMAVTGVDPKHLAMAQAFSRAVAGGKIRVFPLDVRNVQCEEPFDIAVISSWEDSVLPYDRVTAGCRRLVADHGLLVMTFLEKSLIESEGYDYFPDRLLQQKTYHAIAVDELMGVFDRNGFEPICHLDHGYPKVRFPRHVLVGRKRPHAGDGLFAALQEASQRYFDELHRLLAKPGELPPWSIMLNVGPLAGEKRIEDLAPNDRVRLLSLCVRKATCHPFGPWNLDYSRTGFDHSAVLAGLLVGYGNKCGAVAELTRRLLEAHGVACRTIACAGHMPGGEPVQHCLNEVFCDGQWRLLDNDIFQLSDTFLAAGDGALMTRREALALGVGELVRRYPWPYTYRGFDYDPSWVERNWAAWHRALAGTVRDLG